MRILLASDTYPPDVNGAAVFASRLGASLAAHGHKVCQVAPSHGTHIAPQASTHENVDVRRTASARYPWHPSFSVAIPLLTGRTIRQAISQFSPDVIHVQAHFVVGRAALREASRQKIPSVATNHFMPENLEPQLPIPLPESARASIRNWAWRDLGYTYRNADLVTSPTQIASDILRAQTKLTNIEVISNGVPTRSRVLPRTIPEGVATVLYVGRLDPDKRVDELIRAMKLTKSSAVLRIVGTGIHDSHLRAVVAREGLRDRVHFLGYLSDRSLETERDNATLFAMPGRVELQSIASMEAMEAGVPVVAADALALQETVVHGVSGLRYEPGDVAGLATALDSAILNPLFYTILSSGALAQAALHDLDSCARKFEDAYERVIAIHRDRKI